MRRVQARLQIRFRYCLRLSWPASRWQPLPPPPPPLTPLRLVLFVGCNLRCPVPLDTLVPTGFCAPPALILMMKLAGAQKFANAWRRAAPPARYALKGQLRDSSRPGHESALRPDSFEPGASQVVFSQLINANDWSNVERSGFARRLKRRASAAERPSLPPADDNCSFSGEPRLLAGSGTGRRRRCWRRAAEVTSACRMQPLASYHLSFLFSRSPPCPARPG